MVHETLELRFIQTLADLYRLSQQHFQMLVGLSQLLILLLELHRMLVAL